MLTRVVTKLEYEKIEFKNHNNNNTNINNMNHNKNSQITTTTKNNNSTVFSKIQEPNHPLFSSQID